MNRNEYCIVYTYKGSSTDWHVERYNRFAQDAKGLAEFIQKCEDNPSQYEVEKIFRCSFEHLGKSYVESIIFAHKQRTEAAQEIENRKVREARAKLDNNLTIEEQQLLGIIK